MFVFGPIFGISLISTAKITKESYDLMKGLSQSQLQVSQVLGNVHDVLKDLNPFHHEETYYESAKNLLIMDNENPNNISY